jgi:DNA polymerase I-like protein with 3'-5' exonuclease and polymerase domains
MLAAYECYGDSEFFNLSFLAKKLLGKKIKRYREIVGKGETFLDVPFSELVEHACGDADIALQLYHKFAGELKKRKLLDVFLSQRMPFMAKLEMIEHTGLPIDKDALQKHAERLAISMNDLKKGIYSDVGSEIDLDSVKAIGEKLKTQDWFRENFGMRQISTSLIEQMASRHPLIAAIADYRRMSRRKKEIDGIISSVTKGKVFPLFNLIRQPCGKLSSSEPNLDEAFAACAVDHRDLQAEWSSPDKAAQTLLRIASDPVLRADLRTKEPQKNIKDVPFINHSNYSDVLLSIAVNPSEEALSKRFCVSRQTAVKVRREVLTRYHVTFQWLDEFKRSALANGFAEHEGRKKYLDGLRSSDVERKNKAVISTVKWLLRY